MPCAYRMELQSVRVRTALIHTGLVPSLERDPVANRGVVVDNGPRRFLVGLNHETSPELVLDVSFAKVSL